MEIGLALESAGVPEPDAQIVLSRELVGLLSAQLYQSPIKAIEELVVNSYDADATNCWVNVTENRIVVLDNGIGMDRVGIQDLWHVGHSLKRDAATIAARKRRQIGKFGIGKLATAAIANRVTYVTKSRGHGEDHVLTTSVDYEVFDENPTGASAVPLKVRRISVEDLLAQPGLFEDLTESGCDVSNLRNTAEGWTLALLEDLRSEVRQLQTGRLKWVLSTAMPLVADFTLMLGGNEVKSSKEDAERVVEFELHSLQEERLDNLGKATGEDWAAEEARGVSSPTFPNGIRGTAFVTRQSLYGKSDDLARSHGFFIRVRGRLINLDDPLFGLKPSSHSILNRFNCEIDADDLDTVLTAPRENVELSETRTKFLKFLNEVFNQARTQYEAWERSRKNEKGEPTNKPDKSHEHERNYVNPRLVERPIADALLGAAEKAARDDADRRIHSATADTEEGEQEERAITAATSQSVAESGWYYLHLPANFDLNALTKNLYSDEREESYKYERMSLGRTQPMVRLDPTQATFQINVDHDLVRAHDDSPAAQKLLEDVVTAEALLEVYLREGGMAANEVEELLTRRDELLRSLTKDRVYSLSAIASDLRDGAGDETDLEIQLVIAARALGFLARHISGKGEPDGLARIVRHPGGEAKITLEAKSTGNSAVGLAAIGFDGLEEHMRNHNAQGCLLVAPKYPGSTRGEDAAVAKRATEAKVSCWTVEQLAQIVENAQTRHFTATKILRIIESAFTPLQVTAAVHDLLAETAYSDQAFYQAILIALRGLQRSMLGSPRTAEVITARVTTQQGFEKVEVPEVEKALRDLAGASRGAMNFEADGRIVVHTTLDELERRAGALLGERGKPRHAGHFTKDASEGQED